MKDALWNSIVKTERNEGKPEIDKRSAADVSKEPGYLVAGCLLVGIAGQPRVTPSRYPRVGDTLPSKCPVLCWTILSNADESSRNNGRNQNK